jgi:hypothetical protein
MIAPERLAMLRETGVVVHGLIDKKNYARFMQDLWEPGKAFLAGFRRHFCIWGSHAAERG